MKTHKTITLNWRNGQEQQLEVNTLVIKKPYCDLADLDQTVAFSLLKIGHRQLITQIDGHGIKDSLLLAFDESNNYVGVTYIHSDQEGNFGVLAQGSSFLFCKCGTLADPSQLLSYTE